MDLPETDPLPGEVFEWAAKRCSKAGPDGPLIGGMDEELELQGAEGMRGGKAVLEV